MMLMLSPSAGPTMNAGPFIHMPVHSLASLLDNRSAIDALLAWSPWSCRRAVVGEGWAMPGPEEGLGKDRCAVM